MTEFKQDERVSREQAAERLIDIAYALTAGGPLELIAAGRRITVPVEKELRLERCLRSNGDRVELEAPAELAGHRRAALAPHRAGCNQPELARASDGLAA